MEYSYFLAYESSVILITHLYVNNTALTHAYQPEGTQYVLRNLTSIFKGSLNGFPKPVNEWQN